MKKEISLLNRTIAFLHSYNKMPEDVKWCGCSYFWFSWEDFKKLAAETNADDLIASDLLIVGDNWWLRRDVFDSNWEYCTAPEKYDYYHVPNKLYV